MSTHSTSRLADWLAAARAESLQRRPEPMIEQQLLARVRERRALRAVASAGTAGPHSTAARWWRHPIWAAPLVVALALVALLAARWLAPLEPLAPEREVSTPFFALVAAEALAAERAPVVVSSQVPRTTLSEYGLPVDPSRADVPVDADFLMSRSGLVLAVRFRE